MLNACRARHHNPLIAGQAAATRWLTDEVGLDWAYGLIAKLGRLAHETLNNIDGVEVITPQDRMAGLIAFNLTGMEPNDVVTALDQRGFILRTIADPACVRLSTGFYNTEEEIVNLGGAIEEVRDGG